MNFHQQIAPVLLLAGIVGLLGCTAAKKSRENSIGKELVLRLAPQADNPRNSEGSFITLKNGRILFVYSRYTGRSSSDHASAYLALRYSDDQGKTWSSADEKVVEKEGKMNVMSVSLLRLLNGDIALFYLRKNAEVDCIPMMRISKDEGRSWSAPQACIRDEAGYYVLNNDRVIQLQNGRLLMAVARHATPQQPGLTHKARLFVYYSDDNGQNWKRSPAVPNKDDIVTQEPGLVALGTGKLAMFIRTDVGYQYISYSDDEGENWSEVKRWTLKSPLSPASVKNIPGSKKLVAVWNNNYAYNEAYKPNRFPLTIATSTDEGKTWKQVYNIETAPTSFCYTAIHFVKDYVLLAYCSGGLQQTDIVRIPLKAIR